MTMFNDANSTNRDGVNSGKFVKIAEKNITLLIKNIYTRIKFVSLMFRRP